MELIREHFPELTDTQLEQYAQLPALYAHWNAQINVISRKDIDQIFVRHILHSLAIAKFTKFADQSSALDVGTGGGFPGIPLAILYPNVEFHLVDSIGKKIKVVSEIASALNLRNVVAEQARAEDLENAYDYIVSRAVTRLDKFYAWVNHSQKQRRFKNAGLYALKGGDLSEEILDFQNRFPTRTVEVKNISSVFKDPFYETKKVVIVPV